MFSTHDSPLKALLDQGVGERRARRILEAVQLPSSMLLPRQPGSPVTRAELAMALSILLFEKVVLAVPMARAYTRDNMRSGRRLTLDHGAIRSVAAPSGELPMGRQAFARFLEPLGYQQNGIYPLEALGMTGYAYAHADLPEEVPQYFISELHPERFSAGFQAATQRVLSTSSDPLPTWAQAPLQTLRETGQLSASEAARLLPNLVACFDRQHEEPSWSDYQLLLAESDEMAWIATEGNAFNHATDRVQDVAAVAANQRRLQRPVKDELEVSQTGRVIQTAFRATMNERFFVADDGALVPHLVPGSFHEFITRKSLEDGRLDLSFDSMNAQSIFKMTESKRAR